MSNADYGGLRGLETRIKYNFTGYIGQSAESAESMESALKVLSGFTDKENNHSVHGWLRGFF